MLQSEALVCLLDQRRLYPSLSRSIALAAQRYRFTFVDLSVDRPPPPEAFLIRHIIIVDGTDCPETVTRSHAPLLAGFTSATIAMSYSDERHFHLASPVVDRLKRDTQGRINYLLPTPCEHGFVPSYQKLVDNSICDSVRIKYVPACRGELLAADIPAEEAAFFSGVADIFSRYRPYHRAPTDGFISIRSPRGGFYISCTKTDKCVMPPSRVAHVHRYSPDSNILEYTANYLPSSDGVEAATLYDRAPWIRAIVHTHASSLFTRNPRYRHKIAVPPSTYGQAELGNDIADFIERTATRDFVILEDHGEFIFGTSMHPAECLREIHSVVAAGASATRPNAHAHQEQRL